MVIAAMLTIGLFASLGLAQEPTQDPAMKKEPMKQDSMKNDSMKKDGSSALASSDKKFIMEATHGGMMEVELGKLGVEKASSPDVKQFAQRMVDDHSKANDELMQLASQKGVTLSHGDHQATMSNTASGMTESTGTGHSSSADKDHQAMMKGQAVKDKLSKLSGADFDREYMSMMVKDHVKDVKEFEEASSKAKDADLKAWAAKTLPTLREHLQMARDVNSKVAMTKSK
jgi:putative membrane protein